MDCKSYQEQFDARTGEVDSEKNPHLSECVHCQAFVRQERELNSLFEALPSIESPSEFGFSVKSAIARKSSPGARVLRFARVAVPMVLLIAIGFYGLSTTGLLSNGDDPTLADVEVGLPESAPDVSIPDSPSGDLEPEIAGAKPPEPSTEVSDKSQKPEAKQKEGVTEVASKSSDSAPVPPAGRSVDMTGETIDRAFEDAPTINPPGIDPDADIKREPIRSKKKFSDQEVLGILGGKTEWRGASLLVTALTKRSTLQKAGLKIGDVVFSIDGRRVSRGQNGNGTVSGRYLIVIRNGKQIRLTIGSGS